MISSDGLGGALACAPGGVLSHLFRMECGCYQDWQVQSMFGVMALETWSN